MFGYLVYMLSNMLFNKCMIYVDVYRNVVGLILERGNLVKFSIIVYVFIKFVIL